MGMYVCMYVMTTEQLIHAENQRIIQDHNSDAVDQVDPISQITDRLFLGQGRVTAYADTLHKIGITHVVSIGRTPHDPVLSGSFIRFEISDLADRDSEPLAIHFPPIFAFIRKSLKENGKILIHCEMAISRSVAVIIAFLRAEGHCETLQETYDYVKSKRPWIKPNRGFKQQLRDFFFEKLEEAI